MMLGEMQARSLVLGLEMRSRMNEDMNTHGKISEPSCGTTRKARQTEQSEQQAQTGLKTWTVSISLETDEGGSETLG
eukprot:1036179-Rhodomonas_salina.2